MQRLLAGLLLAVGGALASGPIGRVRGWDEVFSGPGKPADFPAWYAAAVKSREETLRKVNYTDVNYKIPSLQWARSSFMQPQAMVHDRFFFDPDTLRYTVDRYVDDVHGRTGFLDSVLVWHSCARVRKSVL